MSKFQGNKSKPRTVFCKFLSSEDKHKVLQNSKKLKNTGIFIDEDLSKATSKMMKSLWEEFLQHRQQNKISYLSYKYSVVNNCIVR